MLTNLASTIEVLICESVITGKIPDTYLQASLIGSQICRVPCYSVDFQTVRGYGSDVAVRVALDCD